MKFKAIAIIFCFLMLSQVSYAEDLHKAGTVSNSQKQYKKTVENTGQKLSSAQALSLKYQEEDYLKNIYRNGVLYKWPAGPVKVYIPSGIYQASAKKAFKEWENKTHVVTFSFVDNPASANIKVIYVNQLNIESYDKTFQSGNCSYKFLGSNLVAADITIYTHSQMGKPITADILYGTILHEVGHAIGFLGHSTNPNDVMATANPKVITTLSSRDINTAIKLYKSHKKYDQSALSGAKVDEYKDFASKVPSNPQSWIDLGNSQYAAKQYPQSITSYQKAISLGSKDINVFINLSAAHMNLKNYPEALNYVKKAIVINPTESKAIGNLINIYYSTGQNDLAKHSLENYLKTYPEKRHDKYLLPYIKYYKL